MTRTHLRGKRPAQRAPRAWRTSRALREAGDRRASARSARCRRRGRVVLVWLRGRTSPRGVATQVIARSQAVERAKRCRRRSGFGPGWRRGAWRLCVRGVIRAVARAQGSGEGDRRDERGGADLGVSGCQLASPDRAGDRGRSELLARLDFRGRVRAADGGGRRDSVHALRRRVSACAQHARLVDPAPRTAAADACKAGGLRPAGRERPRAAARARGRRGPCLWQPVGRVSSRRDSATPRGPVARDRVRRHSRARARAHPRVLGDPGAVPGRARNDARAGGRLVLRRWFAAEHADQASAVARSQARDRDRAQFRRPEPDCRPPTTSPTSTSEPRTCCTPRSATR